MINSLYPMIRCTSSSYMIIEKNAALDAIVKIRLGTKLSSFLCNIFYEIRMRLGSQDRLFVLKCRELSGICGICVIPCESVFDIVFLPEYFDELVSADEERALFEKLYTSADAFGCDSGFAPLIRKLRGSTISAIYEKAIFAPKNVMLSRTAESLIAFIEQKLAVYGIRISKSIAETSSYTEFDPKRLAAELMCMLDMALMASDDGRLCFFVNDDFGRITMGFTVNIGKNLTANYSSASAYLLRRTAGSASHEPIFAYNGNTFSVAVGFSANNSGCLASSDEAEKTFIRDVEYYLEF